MDVSHSVAVDTFFLCASKGAELPGDHRPRGGLWATCAQLNRLSDDARNPAR